MAKILVADDNSNVQKTVALALAELGVEVIAVNNGDAAVKKLADVMPDLVLADIFMPVRNGYEVCEYIKKDSRFSHMPVVLLVGAFDPLDEREAQRVGADGILKKPFVPPDPLMAMVKTLLDRSLGERLVTAAVAKPAMAKQSRSGGVAVADERPIPAAIPEESLDSQDSQEASESNFRPAVERLSFGDGERPVAFSQLLDSPTSESSSAGTGVLDDDVEDEQILTSSRDASLGDPIFWKTEEPQTEAAPESSEAQEKVTPEVPVRGWNLADEASASLKESDSANAPEPLELVRDGMDEDAGRTSTIVEAGPLLAQDAASQASLNVESNKADDLAANPIEWMASVSPPPEEEAPTELPEWGAAVSEAAELIGAKETEIEKEKEKDLVKTDSKPVNSETPAMWAVPLSKVSVDVPSAPSQEAAPPTPPAPTKPAIASVTAELLKTEAAVKPSSPSVEDTVRSMPRHDWTDLAASIQSKPIEPAVEKSNPAPLPVERAANVPAVNAQPAPSIPVPSVLKPLAKNLENSARSVPRLEWAELAASLQPKAAEPMIDKPKAAAPVAQALPVPATLVTNAQPVSKASEAAPPSVTVANGQASSANVVLANASGALPGGATPTAPPDPALVEAVVQRVLEKMRPQVVDIITKEFLRPVVQALVHREITKR